ncbi:MAG: hypothetical protein QNI91_03565 [Arenicellales bacterium]|nr:hypothetical protein [Arenicellales bacterium]
MSVIGARLTNLLLAILIMLVITGCDQIENLTSGGGSEKKTPTQSASGTIADNGESGETKDEGAGVETAAEGSNSSVDDASDENNVLAEASVEEDSEDENSKSDESSNPYAHRNVEQYPRLPSNVTWKPISASSGGNLTIILWGRGGGEKNYEKGSLRIEYNGGVKYPVKEGPRHDGAPRFLFDVQGGWFEGKDPVLFWNLGANRIVHPERRQGKNEE